MLIPCRDIIYYFDGINMKRTQILWWDCFCINLLTACLDKLNQLQRATMLKYRLEAVEREKIDEFI